MKKNNINPVVEIYYRSEYRLGAGAQFLIDAVEWVKHTNMLEKAGDRLPDERHRDLRQTDGRTPLQIMMQYADWVMENKYTFPDFIKKGEASGIKAG